MCNIQGPLFMGLSAMIQNLPFMKRGEGRDSPGAGRGVKLRA